MAAIRGFFAILIGVLVAWIIGAAYDYIRPAFIPNPAGYKFAWPWFFAFSGAVASLIAVLLFGTWERAGAGEGTSKKERPRPIAKSKTIKRSPSTSSDVPGMPTFDVDSLKADSSKKEQGKQ